MADRKGGRQDLIIFVLLCQGVQMFMSYDGGATPASIDAIANTTSYLHWTDAQLGLLGSLDKFGMTLSSVLWGRALQMFPAKTCLMFGLGVNTISTFCFGNIANKWCMFAAKVCMGLTQALQCVWSTCWVLTWAPDDQRTMWLGMGAISAGIGNGIGTAVAGFGTSLGEPYSFAYRIQSSVLAILWCVLVFYAKSEDLGLEKEDDMDDDKREFLALCGDDGEAGGSSTESLYCQERSENIQEDADFAACASVLSGIQEVNSRKSTANDMGKSQSMQSTRSENWNMGKSQTMQSARSEVEDKDSFDVGLPLPPPTDRQRRPSNWDIDHEDFTPNRARLASKMSRLTIGRMTSTRSEFPVTFAKRASSEDLADSTHRVRFASGVFKNAATMGSNSSPSFLEEQPSFKSRNRSLSVAVSLQQNGVASKTARARAQSTFGGDVPILPPAQTHSEESEGTLSQLKTLFRTPLYIRTALTLSAVMFVTSGIQFIWVRLFVNAWKLDKGFVVTGFLVSTGIGGVVGIIFGPPAVDRCGGFDNPEGRYQSLKLICKMMGGAIVGAAIGCFALSVHLQSSFSRDPQAISGYIRDPFIYVFWAGMFILFASFNSSLAGLTGLNVSAVEPHIWSLGSGVTVSLQNLLGYSMGPLLPGLVMDQLGLDMQDNFGQAEALCVGTMFVLAGTSISLMFAMLAWRVAKVEGSDDTAGDYSKLAG